MEASYQSFNSEDGDSSIGPRVDQKRGCDVLDRPEGCILPDTHSPGLLTLPLDFHVGQSLPVQDAMFRPFQSSPGLHQSVLSGVKGAHR